jgi:hypothetical protein
VVSRPCKEALAELNLLMLVLDALDDLPPEVMWPGWCTDEWGRWQQGGCATYARALQHLEPSLRIAVAGILLDPGVSDDWHPTHLYAHDGEVAYDSAGKHPMPYHGLAGDMDHIEPDTDPEDWDDNDEPVEDAIEHIVRNGILDGRYTGALCARA